MAHTQAREVHTHTHPLKTFPKFPDPILCNFVKSLSGSACTVVVEEELFLRLRDTFFFDYNYKRVHA